MTHVKDLQFLKNGQNPMEKTAELRIMIEAYKGNQFHFRDIAFMRKYRPIAKFLNSSPPYSYGR
jgi:hypothetical protein